MLKAYSYQSEHTITFDRVNGELLVNATEMARTFGKQPKDFLKNKSTKEYIKVLGARRKILPTNLVKVINGGNNYGTWLHQKLALRFAQWLSPDFAVWVDEKIEELLTTGKAELQTMSRFDLMRTVINTMEEQELRLRKVEAKVSDINTEYYTLAGYYQLRGRRFDLVGGAASSAGKKLSRASRESDIGIGKAYSAKHGSVNTYHVEVLQKVLGF